MRRAARMWAFSVLLALGGGAGVQASGPPAAPSAAERAGWRADLRLLADTLRERHANAFHFISSTAFAAEVADLDRRIPRLDADQFFVSLARIEASIGDGHTFMKTPAGAPLFGVAFRRFGRDYRLVATAPAVGGAGALGDRLVAVDGTPIRRVRAALLDLTPADETPGLREDRAENLLWSGVVLHGSKIIKRRDQATYTLEDDRGRITTLNVRGAAERSPEGWRTVVTHARLPPGDSMGGFDCGPAGDGATLYCDFRSYADLAHTSDRLWSALAKSAATRLVIDMRDNGGGNFCDGLKYLVEPIARRADLNRPGGLFVLVGPRTFSAAMSNATHFRDLTHAVLVGEPIGEKPNSYQEVDSVTLPHTGWVMRYSTRLYRFTKGGENLVRPDVQIATTWDDFRHGRDPVLARILAQPASSDALRRLHPPAASAVAAEHESCDSPPPVAQTPLQAASAQGDGTAAAAAAEAWRFPTSGSVAVLKTRYAPVAYYRPSRPQRALFLAFGVPWDDELNSERRILAYAKSNLRSWKRFADQNHVLLIAPAWGGRNFEDFREFAGKLIGPDAFIEALADGPVRRVVPGFDGDFCVYGHSAGGQFTARYLVAHPERLDCALLSAPSTYPAPSEQVSWPFGMAPSGKPGWRVPDPSRWLEAVTHTPALVIIGSRDTETRPPAPGQDGDSRLARGKAWVKQMRDLAAAHGKPPRLGFLEVADTEHDEGAMARAARRLLAAFYREGTWPGAGTAAFGPVTADR